MGSVGRRARRVIERLVELMHGPPTDPEETIERMASNMEAESALWARTARIEKNTGRKVYAREKRDERANSARRLRSREEEFVEGIFGGMHGSTGRSRGGR